jgi:uncharacterized membrane protein
VARTAKPLPSLEWLQVRRQWARYISLFSFLALALLLITWNLGFANLHGARPWLVLGIQLLPLLLLAPGMFMGNSRTHAWACFVVNLYFIQGILATFDPNRIFYGLLQTGISLTLFSSALLYTRWSFQHARKLAGE